eukprot:3639652-Alexandrium_andersonii.AAC.1
MCIRDSQEALACLKKHVDDVADAVAGYCGLAGGGHCGILVEHCRHDEVQGHEELEVASEASPEDADRELSD